jgi:hypothetical protein
MSLFYRVAGLTLGVAGIVVAFTVTPSTVTYAPVAGIAVFAVLYVIAQAVERIIEWITDLLKLLPGSSNAVRATAVRELRMTQTGVAAAPVNVEETTEVAEQSRTDILFLTHGLAIALSVGAVTCLNYGIMASLGASNVNGELDRFLTALAAAGGSKGLHELIGRVQVAKDNAQTTGR